jgi:hypothetical protein
MGMAKDYSRVFELENEPSEFVETPVLRKKFRVTIDVEATLASGPQGETLLPSPEEVFQTEALTERLLAQPELVDRLLLCRAVECEATLISAGAQYGATRSNPEQKAA